jgi:hypothetical protein
VSTKDDDAYAAHCEMFRRAGFTAETVARAREAAERDFASKPLPKSPFFAAPPEDPNELVKYVSPRKPLTTNQDTTSLDCEDMAAAYDALEEPTASELPALLEKHASRLAELGHYDIAADVQLASERLPVILQERDDYQAAVRTVADQAGAKICALEAKLKRLGRETE